MKRTSRKPRRTSRSPRRASVRANGMFDWLFGKKEPAYKKQLAGGCDWSRLDQQGVVERALGRRPPGFRYEFSNGYGASVICLSGPASGDLLHLEEYRDDRYEIMPFITGDESMPGPPVHGGNVHRMNAYLARLRSAPKFPAFARDLGISAKTVDEWIGKAEHSEFGESEAERLLREYDEEKLEAEARKYRRPPGLAKTQAFDFGPPARDRDERSTWPGYGVSARSRRSRKNGSAFDCEHQVERAMDVLTRLHTLHFRHQATEGRMARDVIRECMRGGMPAGLEPNASKAAVIDTPEAVAILSTGRRVFIVHGLASRTTQRVAKKEVLPTLVVQSPSAAAAASFAKRAYKKSLQRGTEVDVHAEPV